MTELELFSPIWPILILGICMGLAPKMPAIARVWWVRPERCAQLSARSGSSPPSMLLELYMPGIMIVGVAFCGAEGGGAEVRRGHGAARAGQRLKAFKHLEGTILVGS